jgi:hypothetical protein
MGLRPAKHDENRCGRMAPGSGEIESSQWSR